MTSPIAVRYHFANNLLPDVQDTIIPNGLHAGEVTDWVHPQELGATPQDFYGTQLVVTLDPGNTISESDKANNTATATIPNPIRKVPITNPLPTLENKP